MKEETKGVLTLMIHEIHEVLRCDKLTDIQKLREINTLLEHWIKHNDLHPERIRTIPEEINKQLLRGDKKAWLKVFEWLENDSM